MAIRAPYLYLRQRITANSIDAVRSWVRCAAVRLDRSRVLVLWLQRCMCYIVLGVCACAHVSVSTCAYTGLPPYN